MRIVTLQFLLFTAIGLFDQIKHNYRKVTYNGKLVYLRPGKLKKYTISILQYTAFQPLFLCPFSEKESDFQISMAVTILHGHMLMKAQKEYTDIKFDNQVAYATVI